ncbi:MAG: TlpA family protein disulfide reductase [Chloroflexi bacterium]|nr:TlpA family protein disulfide reductase [Chloroflexota bacterium]
MKASTLFLFAAIFLGGVAVWLGRVQDPDVLASVTAPISGAKAPDFTLLDLAGGEHSLDDYQGRPVIINYWATWCRPCEAEMPALQAVYEKYEDDGLVILAINTTESPQVIEPFIEERGLTFPVLLDERSATAREYGVQAYPSTYFIDRNGIIRAAEFSGPMSQAFIESQVERILN